MNALIIVVPPPLAEKLRERKVADEKINQTVADALWKPLEQPSIPPRKPNETTNEYLRRIILEMRGGVPLSLDDPFVEGMTLGQYLALSEEEEKALWDKWEAEEWDKIEKQLPRGAEVKPTTYSVGQKRGAKVAQGARETRARYQNRRRRAKRG